MQEIKLDYWIFILIASIIQLIIFSIFFDNKKFKNIKGNFIDKTKSSLLVLCIFILPLLYTNFNYEVWFNISKFTIFIGIFCELFISNNKNKLLSYKWFLIIFSFYNIIIILDDIQEAILLSLLIISMDTLMNIIGKYLIPRIPIDKIKLHYPKSISKNKTGLSVILSYITMLSFYLYLFDFWLITIICFGTFFGDAVFSHYKRINKIDDFSNLLGPIGGFSDRFNSWVFTIYFVMLSNLNIATLWVAFLFKIITKLLSYNVT